MNHHAETFFLFEIVLFKLIIIIVLFVYVPLNQIGIFFTAVSSTKDRHENKMKIESSTQNT